MRTIKYLSTLSLLVLLVTMVFSCKGNSKTEPQVDGVDDETVMELPNKSDLAFEKALEALNKKEYETAGAHLATGVKELTEEAKTKGATFKNNLDTSIKHLNDISAELKKGKKVDADALLNTIANAEINLSHDYLVTDDTYVLTEPERVNDSRLHKILEHNLKNLEAGTSKLSGDAKKEGEMLEAEGKKLEDDYKAWKKKTEDHIKKTKEHFKKHQPDLVYESYWGIYPVQ